MREKPLEQRLPWVAALLGIAVALPAIQGAFVWDDRWLILQSPVLRDHGLLGRVLLEGHGWGSMVTGEGASAYFRPLAALLQSLILILFGPNPLPFRILMAILHGGTCLALGFVLRARNPRAAWGAVLFSVHPALADAFGWISASADLLAAALLLASIACIDRPRPWHVAAGLFWLLALLSKESAAIGLPWILLLWWSRSERVPIRSLRPTILSFAVGAGVYLGLRAISAGFHPPLGEYPVGVEASGPVLTGRLFLADFARLLFPARLTLDPPAWVVARGPAIAGVIGIATAFLLAAASIALLMRRGANPAARSLALGYLLCLTGLFPVLQITRTNDIFGGRFLYLPAAGLCIGIGLAIAARRAAIPRSIAVLLLLLLGVLGVRSGIRAAEWRDETRLFGNEYRRQPDGIRGRMLWGGRLMDTGRTEEARPIIEGLTALRPRDPRVRPLQALLWLKDGKVAEAEAVFREIARTGMRTPTLLANLATCQMRLGRLEEGLATLDEATRLTPPTPGMRNNRGNALRLLGRMEEARGEFERAIVEDPSYLAARVNLISLLAFDLHDSLAARASAGEFVRLFPEARETVSVRAILDSLRVPAGKPIP
jgi:protein O-mannosyl-transferase